MNELTSALAENRNIVAITPQEGVEIRIELEDGKTYISFPFGNAILRENGQPILNAGIMVEPML